MMSSNHLLTLISDILNLSKIETGKMDLNLGFLNLPNLIYEITTTLEPLLAKNDNQLEMNVADNLPILHSDEVKVRQIIMNLLSNAIKFTHSGTITLNIHLVNDKQAVEIIVSDTGIGIAPDQIESLFDAFIQADMSTTRQYGGTGLGLTISKKFCEMMGGMIALASELDQGSTFTIQLPIIVKTPPEIR